MSKDTTQEHQNPSYSERATATAHDVVDRVGDKAARAEEQLRDKSEELRQKGYEARARAEELGSEAEVRARSYMQEHPMTSLAVAFGAGVLISALMRR